MKIINSNSIGEKIRELRLENNMSQSCLAEKLHISQNNLSMYENNLRKVPDDILEKLSEIFNVEISFKNECIVRDKNQKKYLVGCINNNLRQANIIKTRFFLVDGDIVEDVTKELCDGVGDITNYEYKDGLANYSFGCGLSHYLQDSNLDKVTTLDLVNTTLKMFNLSDMIHLLNCSSVFDYDLPKSILNYVRKYC